ncbi:hypothetical protein KIK06_20700 [Nocardiopsis sp. EMB25]|uniref:hypothetical protein n=1 Tax=Nocardiopsis TaxID=2013 RepID=UPI00037C7BAB|nr:MULTISPECIES: hypothetical protein [Nocardiopsis]MCY9786317.1 hypothetical protein [Nocardiopsis sp. EMB25]
MSTEAGANPIEAMEGGEYAETLAAAMAGLADMFDLLMEDAEAAAGHTDVVAGFRTFKEEFAQDLIDVQEHGLSLANNIQAGASEIARNDLEGAEDYNSAWDARLEINF